MDTWTSKLCQITKAIGKSEPTVVILETKSSHLVAFKENLVFSLWKTGVKRDTWTRKLGQIREAIGSLSL
jgi:hypothetical protein